MNYFLPPPPSVTPFLRPPSHMVDFMTSSWSDNENDLIKSLYSNKKIGAYALTSGTASEAKVCMERHRGREGLICHFFSGSVVDQMTPGGRHTFLVAPGLWASAIIDEFRDDDVVVKPLFEEVINDVSDEVINDVSDEVISDVKVDDKVVDVEDFDSKFVSGVFGVTFEMPCRQALGKLTRLKPGCPYRLVRFTSVI